MVQYCFEACGSDIAESDVLVPVVSRAESVLGIVQMDDFEILKANNIVELRKSLLDCFLDV